MEMLLLPLTLVPNAPLVPPAVWAVLTIDQEARGETFDGKLAVAEVIRDRARRGYQSDGTIPGTVLKPYQFSGWNTEDPNRLKSAKRAAAGALEGGQLAEAVAAWNKAVTEDTKTAQGALLYHANPMPRGMKKPGWVGRVKFLVQIGAHAFYADPAAK